MILHWFTDSKDFSQGPAENEQTCVCGAKTALSFSSAFEHVLMARSVCVCAELSCYKQHDLTVLQKYEKADDKEYDKEDDVCVRFVRTV